MPHSLVRSFSQTQCPVRRKVTAMSFYPAGEMLTHKTPNGWFPIFGSHGKYYQIKFYEVHPWGRPRLPRSLGREASYEQVPSLFYGCHGYSLACLPCSSEDTPILSPSRWKISIRACSAGGGPPLKSIICWDRFLLLMCGGALKRK